MTSAYSLPDNQEEFEEQIEDLFSEESKKRRVFLTESEYEWAKNELRKNEPNNIKYNNKHV